MRVPNSSQEMVTGSVATLRPPPDYKRDHRRRKEETSAQGDPANRNSRARGTASSRLPVPVGVAALESHRKAALAQVVFVDQEIFAALGCPPRPDEQPAVFALGIVDEGDLPGDAGKKF